MSASVVLAVHDPAIARSMEALLSDDTTIDVRAVATSPESLLAAILDHEPDVVLLHEGFGPAPALTVARDLVGRLPWVSIVLLTRDVTTELYASASDAGIRSLVSMPPSLSDLSARIAAASWWSRAVRVGSEAKTGRDEVGVVLAVAGAKGGVGTTTIATQLAFVAAGAKGRRACLVDLDLFGADLAAFMGTTPARNLFDLVDLSDELSPGIVHPALFPHESGVRVLFAPEDVADAELITASLIRRTVAVLRTMFDVVVLDCGSQVVEAVLPAIELADRVAVVTTPDLLAVRAAHRLAETWERLDVRRADVVELVLNRVSRNAAVQPRLVGQTAAMPVCRVHLPAAFPLLESQANEGASGLRTQRVLAKPLAALALHFGVHPPRTSRFTPLWRWHRASARQAPDAGAPPAAGEPPGRPAAPAADDPLPGGPEPAAAVPSVTPGTGERGALPADLAALGLLLVVGVLLSVQLVLLGVAGAVLALDTPAAAQALAAGTTVDEVQARLRARGALFADAEVSRRGDRVVVSVPVPLAVPGISAGFMSSDATVVSDDAQPS